MGASNSIHPTPPIPATSTDIKETYSKPIVAFPDTEIKSKRTVSGRLISHVSNEIPTNTKLVRQLTEHNSISRELLQQIIKHFPDGMAIIDYTGLIVSHNHAFNRLFADTDLSNGLITSVIPNSVHIFTKIHIGHSMDSKFPTEKVLSSTEFEYKHGNRYIEVCIGRVRLEVKNKYYGYLISFKNVTERRLYDDFMNQLLPSPIMAKIKKGDMVKGTVHDLVTVAFCDIVQFTQLTVEHPLDISDIVTELFDKFDEYSKLLGVTKLQRIGDSYMVACGLFGEVNHTEKIIMFMSHGMKFANEKMGLKIRVGIHCGPLTSGLVGKDLPQFSLFGPTVIIASRLESASIANGIHVTEDVLKQIDKPKFTIIPNGKPNLKGFGSKYNTYYCTPRLN